MKKSVKIILVVLCVIAGIYVSGLVFFNMHYLPGTVIEGIDMSLNTKDEVNSKLSDYADNICVTYKLEGKTIETLSGFVSVDESLLPSTMAYTWPVKLIEEYVGTSSTVAYANQVSSDEEFWNIDESMIAQVIEEIDISKGKEIFFYKGAYLSYENLKDSIIEYTKGNLGNDVELIDRIDEAKEMVSSNEEEQAAIEQANKIISTDITYKDGDISLKLTKKKIVSFIKITEDYEVKIKEKALTKYVENSIAKAFDTYVGDTMTIERPDGSTFDVEIKTYRYTVDVEKESKKLLKRLNKCVDYTGAPIYSSEASRDTPDNYIEVDITNQLVTVVKNGKKAYTTSCVTGKPTSERATKTGAWVNSWRATEWTMVKYETFVHYWMPFTYDGQGLHDATWRSSFGGSIYKYNGSHGCVNLPLYAAKTIYEMTSTGWPVFVHY